MADDFDPLMNPEPEPVAPPPKPLTASVSATDRARVSVALDAPAPAFAPPRPPQSKNLFDNLDGDDGLAAPAPSPVKTKPKANGSALFADDDEEDPLTSDNAPVAAPAPAAAPKAKVSVAAAKIVDAASSNASQFTGVTKRGSTLFAGSDADVISGGVSDVFIPSEARGLEVGIDSAMATEALDDDLLRVDDDDIDSLFADQPSVAAPARKERLGLAAPPSSVGNRNPGVSSLFGPTAKLSASAAAPAANDDDDDLFQDMGGQSGSNGAVNAMSELNLQEYIAKQKSRSAAPAPPP